VDARRFEQCLDLRSLVGVAGRREQLQTTVEKRRRLLVSAQLERYLTKVSRNVVAGLESPSLFE